MTAKLWAFHLRYHILQNPTENQRHNGVRDTHQILSLWINIFVHSFEPPAMSYHKPPRFTFWIGNWGLGAWRLRFSTNIIINVLLYIYNYLGQQTYLQAYNCMIYLTLIAISTNRHHYYCCSVHNHILDSLVYHTFVYNNGTRCRSIV